MKNKYRKIGIAIGVLLLLLVAVWVTFIIAGRFSGSMEAVEIPMSVTERVDEIEIRFSDTAFLRLKKQDDGAWQGQSMHFSFEADPARIQDFLALFNTWEILMIPNDSQREEWKNEMEKKGGKVVLRKGGSKVFSASFLHTDGYFVIDKGRGRFYAMDMPYNQSDNRQFFSVQAENWQNRLLFNLDYTALLSVWVNFYRDTRNSYYLENRGGAFVLEHGKEADTVSVSRAQAYLSSFARVYFDKREAGSSLGEPLYEMEICPKEGRCVAFTVFEKLKEGTPDVFKALAVVIPYETPDTVEIPYVVLDKLAKQPDWFISR